MDKVNWAGGLEMNQFVPTQATKESIFYQDRRGGIVEPCCTKC